MICAKGGITGQVFGAYCAFVLILFPSSSPVLALPENHAPQSFIFYEPQVSDFSTALKSVVQDLDKANQLAKAGKSGQSRDTYTKALKNIKALRKKLSRGNYDELYLLEGFTLEKLDRLEESRKAYKESLRYKSTNTLVMFRHAYVLKNLGRCDAALPEFKEILWRTSANSHEGLYLVAECLIKLGKQEEALKYSEKAHMTDPLFLPVLRQMVQVRQYVLAKEKDPFKKRQLESQIEAGLRAVLANDPGDREAAVAQAKLLLKQGDPLFNAKRWAEAENLVSHFATTSNFEDDESVRLLFDAQVRQGKMEKAEQTLSKGLEKNPKSQRLQNAVKQLEIERSINTRE